MKKESGGEILGRIGSLAARPFVGPARSKAIDTGVQEFVTKRINKPIEGALRKAKLDKAVGKAVEWGTADVPRTPRLVMKHRPQHQRQQLGHQAGEKVVKTLSENPEYLAFPDPVSGKLYMGAKHLTRRALGINPVASPAAGTLIKTAQVNAHQQETEWTCSAACLRAALLHIGYDLPEADLADVIGAREGRGAETTDIVDAAKALGLDAWEQGFDSLEDAVEVLRQGTPIIADIQSFNHPGKGHYVLIAGYRPGQGFVVMDPNTKSKTAVDNWRLIPDEQMEEIWWDRWMAPPHDLMVKWGVMVRDPQIHGQASGGKEKIARLPRLPIGSEIPLGAIAGGFLGQYAGKPTEAERGIYLRNDPDNSKQSRLTGAINGALLGMGLTHGRLARSSVPALSGVALGGALGGVGYQSGKSDFYRTVREGVSQEDLEAARKARATRVAVAAGLAGAGLGSFLAGSAYARKPGARYEYEAEEARRRAYREYARRGGGARNAPRDPSVSYPDWLKGAKTKADAKKRFRQQARAHHSDLGAENDEMMKRINVEWENAQKHPNFPKLAMAILNGLLSEMEKTGAADSTIDAMRAGAKYLGLAGGAYGAAKGMQPDAEGETSPISGAFSGALKGAILGALIAAGLHRNSIGKTTIPNADEFASAVR